MAKRRAPKEPAGSTREAILAAAERIVSRGGEDALSIRELCARVGVTAPTVYHHFGDKDGLLAEVVDACFAEFDRALVAGPLPSDPVAALAWGLDRYVAYGVAHPAHYRLLFARRRKKPTPAAIASYGRLEDAIRAIEAAGRLTMPVAEAAQAAWAAMHGVTMLAIAGFVAADSPAARHVRDALLARLTIPAARPRAATSGGSR
jgi:AcrR family transcriptional regulator